MPSFARAASRRAGAVGVALTALDLWRRLPPTQRRWVADQARHHGPRVAREAREVWAAQQKKRGR
jgi:hypothetical protein